MLVRDSESSSPASRPRFDDDDDEEEEEEGNYIIHDGSHSTIKNGENLNGSGRPVPRPRRLSMYEDCEAVMDPESHGGGEIRKSGGVGAYV